MKKFPGLASFLLFPEKLSRLPVTLPILDTLDSNIHEKTFAVIKQSVKTAKLFHCETKAINYMVFHFLLCLAKVLHCFNNFDAFLMLFSGKHFYKAVL